MKNLKYLIPAVTLIGGLVCATTVFGATYFANPGAATATATSTLQYMTPGAATTTTPIYDTYGANGSVQNTNNTGNTFAAEDTALLVQFTASSSPLGSQLNVSFEYSEDKIDWYQSTPTTVLYGYGTTTLPISLQQVPQYQWKFASSTIGGVISTSTNNFDTRIILTKPLLRYERAIISCAAGGANCAVWAKFVPRKSTP